VFLEFGNASRTHLINPSGPFGKLMSEDIGATQRTGVGHVVLSSVEDERHSLLSES